jgi:hypothetical protein
MPAQVFHFQFLCSLQKDVSASLGDVSVAVLEYCELRPIPAPVAPQFPDIFAFSADPRFSYPDPIEAGQCGAVTSSEQGNLRGEYRHRR